MTGQSSGLAMNASGYDVLALDFGVMRFGELAHLRYETCLLQNDLSHINQTPWQISNINKWWNTYPKISEAFTD